MEKYYNVMEKHSNVLLKERMPLFIQVSGASTNSIIRDIGFLELGFKVSNLQAL